MIRLLWLCGAALLAALVAAWSYGRREESIPGRAGPAVARALALFLILAGPALPALWREGAARTPGDVVLLDVSRSMELGSRIDSARAALRGLRPGRVLLFGEEARPAPLDSAMGAPPSADRTRLVPALEAARLSGADSVWVVSDGEWDDRTAAEAAARRLGLGLREVRVGERVSRLGLDEPSAPVRARAGDTLRIAVDLAASGPGTGADRDLPDSVRVDLVRADSGPPSAPVPPAPEAAHSDAPLASAVVPVPAQGRTARVELAFVPGPPRAGDLEWRTYEVRLPRGADPWEAADRRRFSVEVSETPGGAVLVAFDPDWEPRFLLPRLERAVLGGAAGFLHLGEDRWLEMGPRPAEAAPGDVRRAAARARLLVVQGGLSRLPGWLARRVESHPRRLLLPRGPGRVPGTPISLAGPLPGEWYPSDPIPSSPIARYLGGIALEALPPLPVLYGVEDGGGRTWTPLLGRRNRRGEARPLTVAGGSGGRRWAVAAGEGYWRWVGREGAPRRLYEAMVTGLAGWLLEDAAPQHVELVDPGPGHPLRWRIAPGVRDLRLAVREAEGGELWSDSFAFPSAEVTGPTLEAGRYVASAEGTAGEGAFRWERPLELAPDPRETLPRTIGPPLEVRADPSPGAQVPAPRPRPVWPLLAAAVLLCGEWVWRRRIGLR